MSMDKQFWLNLRENGYQIPEGHTAAELTEHLFDFAGSTDPELRDTIGYETFAAWMERGGYTPEQMSSYITRLILNLQEGLGETGTDSVFNRAFSVLYLAEIIHHDNKKALLERDTVLNLFAKALAYFEEEKDLRGYVEGKGWAHATAHTADLLYVLGSNRFLAREELEKILYAITNKLTRPTQWTYLYGEDDRLVQAVVGVIQRRLLDEFHYKDWLKSFIYQNGVRRPWKKSFEKSETHNAYFHTRNFLRSLYLRVLQNEKMASRDFLLQEIAATLQELKQF